MFRGVFALFFRSLRGDSRSVWVHASWFLLLIVIYVLMCLLQSERNLYGAPGLRFFRSVIYSNAVFVTLLGISYFSSAISEEKEEDTLGLMTMAGISPLGILLGKSTTRLFQVFLLLAVQYPFTLLAITLGGLMSDQIMAAYAALIAFTILLANVGLFCSTICRRNRDASGLTTLWMVGYCFIPLFAFGGYQYLMSGAGKSDPRWMSIAPDLLPILLWISRTNVFGELAAVTDTGYQFGWTPQLFTNTFGGIALFFLSWRVFGHVSHDPAPEAMTRAMVPRKIGRLNWLSAGRSWDAALAWKDFHFIAGGWFGFLIRCGLYVGLYWLAFAVTVTLENPNPTTPFRWQDVTVGYQIFVVPLFVVDCAMCVSRLFQEEIRYQTLASLLMLPQSVPNLVYTKLAGCLAALIPGMIGIFTAFMLLTETKSALIEMIDEPPAWWVTANLFLVIHLSAMLSLYLRWGAFAIALLLTWGSMFISIMVVEFLFRPLGQNMEPAFGFMAFFVFFGCACCHFVVLARLPALGEK